MSENFVDLAYLLAAALFILGIKGLTRPRTAVRGNMLSATGMLIAVVVTLLDKNVLSYEWIIGGIVLGGVIGAVIASRIQMTAIPQMVALLNGFGGGASLAVAVANYFQGGFGGDITSTISLVAIGATTIIGAVTLTGSLVAFGKLQEILSGQSIGFPGMKFVNALLLITAIYCVVRVVISPDDVNWIYIMIGSAAVLGLLLVLPIGGADMPVVIALLNSYSGIAAASAGFIMNNTVLIVTGSLVGASGLILTQIMCVAMNRSLFNVLFGVMAEGSEAIDADEVYAGKVKKHVFR